MNYMIGLSFADVFIARKQLKPLIRLCLSHLELYTRTVISKVESEVGAKIKSDVN